MLSRQPHADMPVPGLPIVRIRIRLPVALFVTALFTDLVYWQTADPLWSTMSSWLLLLGLVWAFGSVLLELIRLLRRPGLRRLQPARLHLLGNGLAVLLSVANFIFHVRDGYSAVVPAGPLLSAAVVVILIITGWTGLGLVRRHRTAAADGDAARLEEA